MADVLRRPQAAAAYVPPDTIHGQVWWVQPLLTVVILTLFGLYALWTSLQGNGYADPYLSPFYSPRVPFGGIFAPLFILWIPLGFRASCYYYRKAYYRSFFWDPPACARPDPHTRVYRGETALPFILNNVHRYFLYLSIIVIIVLWYDTIRAFDFDGHFGIGLGTIIMLANVIALTAYTFSCHSWRHLIGGGIACFSCAAAGDVRHRLWRGVSVLNGRHANYAWISLTTLFIVDVYIRLLIGGVISDPRWVL